jgi:hypothetical protein
MAEPLKVQDPPKIICDACGDDCTEFTGVTISVKNMPEDCESRIKIEKRFGKVEFSICPSCWLKSMGVQELPTIGYTAGQPLQWREIDPVTGLPWDGTN